GRSGGRTGPAGRRSCRPSWNAPADGGDAKADVVVTPLRFVPQPGGRPAGPAMVAPGAAPAHAGIGAVPVPRSLHRRQIRIVAAGQFWVIPIPAPLEDVAVHVVQPPSVGGVAADLGGPIERLPFLGAVVRLPLEVCLLAAELVPKCGGRLRPGPAGVLPLCL